MHRLNVEVCNMQKRRYLGLVLEGILGEFAREQVRSYIIKTAHEMHIAGQDVNRVSLARALGTNRTWLSRNIEVLDIAHLFDN